MAKPVKILAFSGSTRKDSWNKKLLKVAIESFGSEAEVTVLDLKDYPLPLYDADLEEAEGQPENAHKLRKIFAAHDGFLIASPEYNGSYSGVLKNTLDWVSRPDETGEYGTAFRGKVAVLLAASEGTAGGRRGLDKLQSLLFNLKVIVLPDMYGLGSAAEAFNKAGRLKDKTVEENVHGVAKKLVTAALKLSA